MKHVSKQLNLLILSVLLVLGLAVVPVGAEHGTQTEGTDDSTGSSSDEHQTTTTNTTTTETETETETGGDQSLRDQAKQLLQDKRKNIKEHTQEQKQKACEQRQKSIEKRTSNFSTAAQRHLEVFNKIFVKVQAFHDSKGLDVANYDALVAAATAKQTAAQNAVDALKALNVQIDCTQTDPATTVATIKTAVSDARTALQTYRKSLVDLITALKGASTAQDNSSSSDTSTTTGGTQ